MSNISQNSGVTMLDHVVLVQLDIRSSNLGGKVEREHDLKGLSLPPRAIISDGIRHFCDSRLNQPFNTIRKKAERVLSEAGIALYKGYAIPVEKAKEVDQALRTLASEYENEAILLERILPSKYKEWEEKQPEYVELLRRNRPSPTSIRSRYRFGHAMYRIKPASDDIDDPLNEGFTVAKGTLLDSLLEEISDKATAILEKHYTGRDRLTRPVVDQVAALGEKIRSFSIIDPFAIPLSTEIATLLSQIGGGPYSFVDIFSVKSLLEKLSKPDEIRAFGQRAMRVQAEISGNSSDDVCAPESSEIGTSVGQTYAKDDGEVNPKPDFIEKNQPVAELDPPIGDSFSSSGFVF